MRLAEAPNARGPSRRTSPQELLVYAVKAYAGCCCGYHVHFVVPHALRLPAAADEGKLASAAVLVLELVDQKVSVVHQVLHEEPLGISNRQ